MDSKSNETALGFAGILVLEAVGLEVAHTETLGAVIAIFAAALSAYVLGRMTRDPS